MGSFVYQPNTRCKTHLCLPILFVYLVQIRKTYHINWREMLATASARFILSCLICTPTLNSLQGVLVHFSEAHANNSTPGSKSEYIAFLHVNLDVFSDDAMDSNDTLRH